MWIFKFQLVLHMYNLLNPWILAHIRPLVRVSTDEKHSKICSRRVCTRHWGTTTPTQWMMSLICLFFKKEKKSLLQQEVSLVFSFMKKIRTLETSSTTTTAGFIFVRTIFVQNGNCSPFLELTPTPRQMPRDVTDIF